MTRREKREKGMGDPRFTAGDRGRGGSGTARTLSAMVLRTSSVLILESATALTDTERLTASCERAGGRNGRRQKEGDDGVMTDGAVRRSRASRARDASTNTAFATKRRGEVLPNDSGRPRATGRAASRARGRIRRADVTATGPPGLNIAGVFFRERRRRSGLTLGCATFTPLKVVARRERAARALGAAARGARIATGATMAAMITAVLLDVISTPSLSGAFPPAGFFVERPTVAKKQNQRLFSHTNSAKHPRRSPRIGTPVVRQSQNLPSRLASCHTNRNAGRTDRRAPVRFWFGFGNRRFAADSIDANPDANRSGRSVGRVGPRALLPNAGCPSVARVVVCLRRARGRARGERWACSRSGTRRRGRRRLSRRRRARARLRGRTPVASRVRDNNTIAWCLCAGAGEADPSNPRAPRPRRAARAGDRRVRRPPRSPPTPTSPRARRGPRASSPSPTPAGTTPSDVGSWTGARRTSPSRSSPRRSARRSRRSERRARRPPRAPRRRPRKPPAPPQRPST